MQAFLIFCTFNVICAMIVILSDSYFILNMLEYGDGRMPTLPFRICSPTDSLGRSLVVGKSRRALEVGVLRSGAVAVPANQT